MARIRTIKPEFPHSESMGNVSRDARLTFILLWTISDDSGKLRGNSRMLASLLFPYDEDAGRLIDGWLSELERQQCITRYQIDGTSYVRIEKWESHQKVDKPSRSKIPDPRETSRGVEKPREASCEDQRIEGPEERTDDAREVGLVQEESPLVRSMRVHPEAERIRTLIVARWPHLGRQNASAVSEWLFGGASIEEDILPTIEHVERSKGGDVGSFRYFTPQVMSAVKARNEQEEVWRNIENGVKCG